jgi:hypothetical protein
MGIQLDHISRSNENAKSFKPGINLKTAKIARKWLLYLQAVLMGSTEAWSQ